MLDFHGSTWREQRGPGGSLFYMLLSRFMESQSFRFATHILAVSDGTAAHLPARVAKKVIVLKNGVDVEGMEAVQAGSLSWLPGTSLRTVGVVARFGEHLELKTIRDAIALVRHPVRLVLVGDGPVLDAMGELRGDENILRPGKQSQKDTWQFLRHHCDVALCPYDPAFGPGASPGFYASRKVREYLAAGLPVIVPDISGLDRMHEDGVNCLMYKPGDAHALAAQMDRLVDEPCLAGELREQAAAWVEASRWSSLSEASGFSEQLRGWGSS